MIALISTGGTILSSAKDAKTCADYSPDEQNLGKLTGLIDEPFSLHELCNIDSSNMDEPTLCKLARLIISLKGVSGVVLMHGTDTMEESAFFLDCLDLGVSVVLTGAMRPATAIGFEGEKNLLNAFKLIKTLDANDPVMLCMNDKFFTAKSAYKAHSMNVDAFCASNASLAGTIADGVRAYATLAPRLRQPLPEHLGKVGLLYSHVGLDPRLLQAFAAYDALVIAGYGSGTINDDVIEAARKLKIPLILSTRVNDGGLSDKKRYEDMIFAYTLSPLKARLLAAITLGNGKDLREVFSKF